MVCFVFVSLSGFLSACFTTVMWTPPRFAVELTSRAKLESSCQSKIKKIFLRTLFTCQWCTFNLDILSHIITSERLFGFTLYISLVNSIICDEISESNHLRVSAICINYKSLKKEKDEYFLICSNEEEGDVALLSDVIKWYCVMTVSSVFSLDLDVHYQTN